MRPASALAAAELSTPLAPSVGARTSTNCEPAPATVEIGCDGAVAPTTDHDETAAKRLSRFSAMASVVECKSQADRVTPTASAVTPPTNRFTIRTPVHGFVVPWRTAVDVSS